MSLNRLFAIKPNNHIYLTRQSIIDSRMQQHKIQWSKMLTLILNFRITISYYRVGRRYKFTKFRS